MSNTSMAKIGEMAKGLQKSAQQAAEQGVSFMKFTKFGSWLHGADDVEAEEDSKWLVHPETFTHGWIAWGDKSHSNHGEKLGEVSVSATEPLPAKGTLPQVEGSWAQQVSLQLLCLDGMDKGTAVCFNSSSTGGRRAYQEIVNAVVEQITSGEEAVAPVVTLSNDSYKHKDFGQISVSLLRNSKKLSLSC